MSEESPRLQHILNLLDDHPTRPVSSAEDPALERIQRVFGHFQTHHESPPELHPGQHWDRLEVGPLIGRGGMGSVHRAHDNMLNRSVALKSLSPHSARFIDPEEFVREAQHMAQVRHPHIMAVFGAGTDQGVTAYWGELLSGQHLIEWTQANPDCESGQRLRLAAQLAQAVQAIHRAGLIHGDIKALNIMLEPQRGAVLMDFGASKTLKQDPTQRWHPQTPLAMAPEQFDGQPASQSSDVFALGVVFCLLFYRQYPFTGEDFASLANAVRNAAPDLPAQTPGLGRPLRWLILDMLDKDPRKRPDADAVVRALEYIRTLPLRRARRRTAVLATLFVATIVAGSLFTAWKTEQSRQSILTAQQETNEVNRFLEEILRTPASNNLGKDVKMLHVIEAAEQRVAEDTQLPQSARTRIQYALAFAWSSLDESERAADLLRTVVDNPDASDLTRKQAMMQWATLLIDRNEMDLGKDLIDRAEAIDVPGRDGLIAHARTLATHANWLQKQQLYAQSLELCDASIAMWDQVGEHKDKTYVLILKGKNLSFLGDLAGAERVFTQAWEHSRATAGDANINTIITRMAMATYSGMQGKADEALYILNDMLPSAIEFLGRNNRIVFAIRYNRIDMMIEAGLYSEAEQAQQALLSEGADSGGSPLYLAVLKGNMAKLQAVQGRDDRARDLYLEAIDEMQQLSSAEDRYVLDYKIALLEIYNRLGQAQKTLELAAEIREPIQRILGEASPSMLQLLQHTAWAEHLNGRHEQARTLMQAALDAHQQALGDAHERTLAVQQQLHLIEGSIQPD